MESRWCGHDSHGTLGTGIARALMAAVHEEARMAGRRLLTLDTLTGGAAEPLYLSMGYVVSGVIPEYALNYNSNAIEPTTVMYKRL
ncbi:MAG: hypothetical protein C5B51_28950 [Terriglobia bacterium]|nr:MAG: hypothetical protein C5B51_28950 [Terriglobia bacterium]